MSETNDSREFDSCVLQILQGIKCAQRDIRNGQTDAGGRLVEYVMALPESVSRRLTELNLGMVQAMQATAKATNYASVAPDFGSDEAWEQVIRAVNFYRARLGLAPLGPDGWPDGWTEGGANGG